MGHGDEQPGIVAVGGGGEFNQAQAGAATVSGGENNTASGTWATVPGGLFNTAAGEASFAAGVGAEANAGESFVWNDNTAGAFSTTGPYQFLIHASGRVGIGLNNPAAALHVASPSSAPEFQITQQNASDYTRLRMNVGNFQSWEMHVSPGSTPSLQFWNSTLRMNIDYNGNVTANTFTPTSDRNAKENFAPVNVRDVLDKVVALPVTRWNFKNDSGAVHVGPMAQDFHAAFNVGMDDKHIATLDADGVALAAIQGLNEKLEAEIKAKNARIAELEIRLSRLEASTRSRGSNGPAAQKGMR